jgi:hypothetical protein
MKYLLLIYADESGWAKLSDAEQGQVFGEHMALVESLRSAGKMLGGEPLEPSATASTLRLRAGKAVVTDGPFAEAREQLGGFYLIEAGSLDDALAVAARIPEARSGAIEVRPVMPIPES